MSIVALIPVAQMAAANLALEEAGFGPGNFSVPAYGATGVTHAALHAWEDSAFREALALVPGVVVGDPEDEGDPITLTAALIAAQGAKWGAQAPALPTTGNVTAGSLYRFEDGVWSVIQAFSRTTYGAHPSTYPALIRKLRDPYKTEAWRQPIDQYDSYRLLNPFTGKPDECIYAGKTWRTKVDNNVWEPAVGSLWDEINADGNVVVPPANEYPQWVQPTGGHDAYKIGDKVTFNGQRYTSKINGNVWSPTGYPAGWQVVT
jgi:hypothetical protein